MFELGIDDAGRGPVMGPMVLAGCLIDEKTAKENGLFEERVEYKPITICIGQGQIIKGLDKALVGKEPEKQYTIEIKAEDAYGKKNAKLIQLISTSKFRKENLIEINKTTINITIPIPNQTLLLHSSSLIKPIKIKATNKTAIPMPAKGKIVAKKVET